MIEISSSDEIVHEAWDDDATRAKLVILKFTAEWCRNCQEIQPQVETLAAELCKRATFLTVNVNESPELVSHYKVRLLPHFVILQDGVTIGQIGNDFGKLKSIAVHYTHVISEDDDF